MDGSSTTKIEIYDELLQRASMNLWDQNCEPIGAMVNTGSLCRQACVLASFIHHSIYPSSHRAALTRCEHILVSCILHKEPFCLASTILEQMIYIGDPIASKKEVLMEF